MGRIIKKNIISGTVGNLVFRNLNGRQIVQMQPQKFKQTKATMASSSEFQQCSTWAKELRMGLYPFLVNLTDSYMYRRLTGQFYNALRTNTHLPKGKRTPLNANLKDLEGFEFNTHSPFKEYFTVPITVVLDAQRQLHITIPKLDPRSQIVFTPQADNAELVVAVYATNFEDPTKAVEAFFTLPIQKNTPLITATEWTSPPIPENFFVVVTAKLLFYTPNKFTEKNYWNSKTLNPAGLIFCEGSGN
ncbi:MAG: hypothetical protein EOO46_02275 [Flavobacterium sp.]|nr:MAG: hypothetical protein EOO46_02275 [Flavobacterium sp.]